MLVVCIGRILLVHHDTEMIKHAARVDRRSGLGTQLGAPHVAVPERGTVNGNLSALRGPFVGGILEARIEIDVFGDVPSAMNVVLIGTDLIGP